MKALDVITDALSLVVSPHSARRRSEASALAVRTLNRMLLEWSTKSVYSPAQYDQSCPSPTGQPLTFGDVGGGPTPGISTSPGDHAGHDRARHRRLADVARHPGRLAQDHAEDDPWRPELGVLGLPAGQSRLYLWPIPVANMTVRIVGIQDIATIRNAQSEILLPADCEEALVYNLAKRLMPSSAQRRRESEGAGGDHLHCELVAVRHQAQERQHARDARSPTSWRWECWRGNDGYLNWRGRAV